MFELIGNGADKLYDEVQQTMEMTATLLSTAIGRKAQIHDSIWKTANTTPWVQLNLWRLFSNLSKVLAKQRNWLLNSRKTLARFSCSHDITTMQLYLKTAKVASYYV
jgi:malate synthase